MKVSLNDIVIHPTHPIHKFRPLRNLVNKRNSSQKRPVVIKKDNHFILYSGEKILRTAKNKNKSKIDCIIKDTILDIDALNLSEIYSVTPRYLFFKNVFLDIGPFINLFEILFLII